MLVSFILLALALQTPAAPPPDDPSLVAAVHRFFEMQQKEDVAGYLSLWSASVQAPQPMQLKYIFDNGDDVFSEITIVRTMQSGPRTRVQVTARRDRTIPSSTPGGAPFVRTIPMQVVLAFVRDGAGWKLIREGGAADDLAAEILELTSPAERDALVAAQPELDGVNLLASISRLGGLAASVQNYKRAEEIFQEVVRQARRTSSRKEEGEALQNLANARYFQRRFAEALAAYEERLTLERERGDDAAVAAALSGAATMEYSLAEYTRALARYQEALAIHERLDDVAGIAFASLSVGNITYLQGDFQAAIAAFRRSLVLNRTMFSVDGESRALEGLGLVYSAQGNYAAALESFDAVLKDPRMKPMRDRLGAVAHSAGDAHFRLGNLDAARAMYEESRGHYEARRDMPNVGRVFQALGMTELVAGRYSQAQDLYKRSASTCEAAGDPECAAHATAGFAYTQVAQDKFTDAAASYHRAIQQFVSLKRAEDGARSQIGLSEALLGDADVTGAMAAAARARQAAVALDSDDVLWRALTAEARAVRKAGDKQKALGVARAAAGVLERLDALALDRPGGSLPSGASSALATFAILQAETGDPGAAFLTTQRVRTIELRNAVALNERDIARGMSAEEREEERALAAALTTANAQLTREKGLPKPDAARVAALQKAVAEAVEKRRSASDRLFQRLPDLRVWRGLAPPRMLADAAPLVESDGSILISFIVDEDDLLALVVSRAKADSSSGESGPALPLVDSYVLPAKRRKLAALVAALQQPAVLSEAAAWRSAAAELTAILGDPVMGRLASASAVSIEPHDVLWRVPFAALPSGDGFLIDQVSIVLGGSVDALLRSHQLTRTAESLTAIASPVIEVARTDRIKQVAPGWILRAAEAAAGEVKAAAGAYDPATTTLLDGNGATEAAVRRIAGDASILHIAAPFRINAASPLFSAVLLSEPATPAAAPAGAQPPSSPSAQAPTAPPAQATPAAAEPRTQPAPAAPIDPADDGSLELREIANLDLRAMAAVFSDGAATSMRDGASAAGVVQWEWLAAGVPSLLLSRWTAPDASRDALVGELYAQLRRGEPLAAALRAAQLAVRKQAETAAPLHWSGWMLIGAR